MLALGLVSAWIAIVLLGFAIAALQRQIAGLTAPARRPLVALPAQHVATLNLPALLLVVEARCDSCSAALEALPPSTAESVHIVAATPYPSRDDIAVLPELVSMIDAPAMPWVVTVAGDGSVITSEPYVSRRRLRQLIRTVRSDAATQTEGIDAHE